MEWVIFFLCVAVALSGFAIVALMGVIRSLDADVAALYRRLREAGR